jgi:hypothetical protein
MKHRILDGELWVLVEVYVAACGFVAHWFSHSGMHSYEPIEVKFKMTYRDSDE